MTPFMITYFISSFGLLGLSCILLQRVGENWTKDDYITRSHSTHSSPSIMQELFITDSKYGNKKRNITHSKGSPSSFQSGGMVSWVIKNF